MAFSWRDVIFPLMLTVTVATLLVAYFQTIPISGYKDNNATKVDFGLDQTRVDSIENDYNNILDINYSSLVSSSNTQTSNSSALDIFVNGASYVWGGLNVGWNVVTSGLGMLFNIIILLIGTIVGFSWFIDKIFTGDLALLGLIFKVIIAIAQVYGVLSLIAYFWAAKKQGGG